MKNIVLSPSTEKVTRKSYAIKRMNLAAERLLGAESAAEEIQAGHWVLAWAVAAGARPSARSVRQAEAEHATLVELRLH